MDAPGGMGGSQATSQLTLPYLAAAAEHLPHDSEMESMERQAVRGWYEISRPPAAHARYICEMATSAWYETKNPPAETCTRFVQVGDGHGIGNGRGPRDAQVAGEDVIAGPSGGEAAHDPGDSRTSRPIQVPTAGIRTVVDLDHRRNLLDDPWWRFACYLVATVLVIRHYLRQVPRYATRNATRRNSSSSTEAQP